MIESATVTNTGDRVRVLRRTGSIRQDEQIMRALDAADCYVIGIPQAFRYRSPGKPGFTRPGADDVLLLDDEDRMTAVVPGGYFHAHYRIEAAQ